MKKKEWNKSSEKLLDELFDGKEEISLYDKEPAVEEKCIGLFERFCILSDKFVETGKPEKRDILLIILKDTKKLFRVETKDITGVNPEEVKSMLKDKDMFGYITSFFVKKLDKDNNLIENAVMRTLYTAKIFLRSIMDVGENSTLKPVIIKDRTNIFCVFDLWALNENPRNK